MTSMALDKRVGVLHGRTQVENTIIDQDRVIRMLMDIYPQDGGQMGFWDLKPLITPKICSPQLAKAILDFQQIWKGRGQFRIADGVVDPGGTTWKKLYSLSTGSIPPSGVIVPPQPPSNPREVKFSPPIFYGPGVKISLADATTLAIITGFIKQFSGIEIPTGCDIILTGLRRYAGGNDPRDFDPIPSGYLLGITPRYRATPKLVAKLSEMARQRGMSQSVVKAIQSLERSLSVLPTSLALAGGFVVVMARGFNSVNAMAQYKTTEKDALSWNFAGGRAANAIVDALTALADMNSAGLASDAAELLSSLSENKVPSIAVFEVPGASIGFDIGASIGTARWWSVDINRFG